MNSPTNLSQRWHFLLSKNTLVPLSVSVAAACAIVNWNPPQASGEQTKAGVSGAPPHPPGGDPRRHHQDCHHLFLLQIQLFFLECQNQQCGPIDYSHFPGYARFSIWIVDCTSIADIWLPQLVCHEKVIAMSLNWYLGILRDGWMKSVAEIKQKMSRNKKNEKSVGLAELRREQERLLYLCDSIKLSVTKEEARVSSDDDYDEDDCTVVMISNFDDAKKTLMIPRMMTKFTQVPLIKLITMIGTAFSRVVELMLSIQVWKADADVEPKLSK